MKWGMITWMSLFHVSLGVVLLPGCSSSPSTKNDRSSESARFGATAAYGGRYRPVPAAPPKSPRQLYREVNIKHDIIPRGKHARKYRRYMKPRYITIHSTQNFSRSADALRHSLALKNGKLRAPKCRGGNRIGYLVWHFTTDQDRAVQHLPTNEQGEHADFDGPGNNYSIGIEMCENRGNSRSATIERTAKLAAYLMHQHDIPLRKIVPHYHWPRKGLKQPHKNCPHYLLDNGHPGAKWQWFLAKVNKHFKSISHPKIQPNPGASPYAASYVATSSRATSSIPIVASSSSRAVPRVRSKLSTSIPKVRYHSVKRGDTLYGIARKYKTSVAALKTKNGLRSNIIGIGKRLRLP